MAIVSSSKGERDMLNLCVEALLDEIDEARKDYYLGFVDHTTEDGSFAQSVFFPAVNSWGTIIGAAIPAEPNPFVTWFNEYPNEQID